MAIKTKIKNTTVFFTQIFRGIPLDEILAEKQKSVVFIDGTPSPAEVSQLLKKGVEAVVRDHHGDNPRDAQKFQEVRALLGGKARIESREDFPACSMLFELGEFDQDGVVIVSDSDPDGLTASMKAVGVSYPEMDADSVVLDGPRSGQTRESLSETAFLLVMGLATLPPFNRENEIFVENKKKVLFEDFIATVQGDIEAMDRLQKVVKDYESLVEEASKVAETAEEVMPGIWLVDLTKAGKIDMSTLIQRIESKPGQRVLVQLKGQGPIAEKHGLQYSFGVNQRFKDEINLRRLVEGEVSSLENGVIANTSFLLHLSEEKYKQI